MTDLLTAALANLEAGFPVLPLKRNDEGKIKVPDCPPGWDRWFTQRQTEAEVRELFRNGALGLGCMLYPASPYVVLDFDGKHAFEAWKQTELSLDGAARVTTQSGGVHLYFAMRGNSADIRQLKRSVRLVKAHCDCEKTCGVDLLINSYAVAPPTPGYHEDPDHPLECAVEIPPEIISFALSKQRSERVAPKPIGDPQGRIPKGERNATLVSLAGGMRARGMSVESIRAALHTENEQRCNPPLDDREIETIVRSASEWPEGAPKGEPHNSKRERTPITIRVSEVQREEVSWLWHHRIPLGKLTIIEGDPGEGKSFLSQAIAAAVSKGFSLPGETEPRNPDAVVIMSAEDGLADTIRPRLEDMEADLDRVIALRGLIDDEGKERPLTLADLDVIEKAVMEHRPALVIIDPIIAYVAGKDTHKANEVRSLLAPVAALAEKHKTAILAIRHLNKGTGKASYRGQGTIDFLAACRSAFLAGEDPDDPSQKVLCHIKANLGPKTPPLTYTINEGRFLWGKESSLTAEEILAVPVEAGEKKKLDDAMDFLRDLLSNGPVASSEVNRGAKAAGIASATLKRAKMALGVKAKKRGLDGGWQWELPDRRSSSPDNEHLRGKALNEREKTPEKSPKVLIVSEEAHPSEGGQDEHLR